MRVRAVPGLRGTAELSYRNEEERQDAARRVALNWNLGKVIYPGPGD